MIRPTDRKPSECSCISCKTMCIQSPCFGTPEEIEKLMNEGYTNRLSLASHYAQDSGEMYYMVQPKSVLTAHGCTFQNLGTGLCELHDKGLKPLEGRLAHHAFSDDGLREHVCKTWRTLAGIRIITMFVKATVK